MRGEDAQIDAVAAVIAAASPDVIVLQGVDYDLELHALGALRDRIADAGAEFGHFFALRPNRGMPTGQDMDGNGRLGEPVDRQAYGGFSGQGGMAILSRYPIDAAGVRDFSGLLWKDLPGADLQMADGTPVMAAKALAVQRLSSVGHWVVPVMLPEGPVHLLTFHATTPVFDGPEDRNGRRNHDELRFWSLYMDGAFGPPPAKRFVLLGAANLAPDEGEGRHGALRALLDDPRLQDPRPRRSAPVPRDPARAADPAFDTVHWPDPGPGGRRVDYILPSADLEVLASGVLWPAPGAPLNAVAEVASRHRLVWADLMIRD
ncbi:endonuclease/exonuclease/phosphatase family protein [Roseovarius halotolerans]|uniref:Endonuclease/exonuclease/phosphatase domain-containing protein n=1 Tax=Roseovarius halotolerans TaxID=505353 RepID=A0A1X6Z543_9RHOB|nr:endonuclease/exonuclease/phosphatase family protein [Roseovarius halotolerans]SLN41148.1 hypothetical protein ROH8110_02204 [Roseovarius halotolerans]